MHIEIINPIKQAPKIGNTTVLFFDISLSVVLPNPENIESEFDDSFVSSSGDWSFVSSSFLLLINDFPVLEFFLLILILFGEDLFVSSKSLFSNSLFSLFV